LNNATAYGTFERELEAARLRFGFVVAGYVLMPEHVHLLMNVPTRSSLAVALQVLKQQTSRKAEAARTASVLAAPLLRLQRAQRRKEGRKTSLHASQSRHARSRREARRLAMVELPALRDRGDGLSRD
jgi:REP element-mobilizing transposase RayT